MTNEENIKNNLTKMSPDIKFCDFFREFSYQKNNDCSIIDIIEQKVDSKYYLNEKLIKNMFNDKNFLLKLENNKNKANSIIKIWDKSITGKKSQGSAVYHYLGLMPTLTAGTHGYAMGQILDLNNNVRKITPIEAERFMGWPDNWTQYGFSPSIGKYELSDTARYKAIGNGIVSIIPKTILDSLTKNDSQIKIFSTFSGVDGSCLLLDKKQYKVVAFSEFDPKSKKEQHASNVLAYHYPTIPNLGDISKINVKDVPDHDLMFISAPCQSFSIAGKRAGLNDVRGTLFYESARILKDKKPKFFLFENVKGLLNHEKGKTFQIMCEVYSSIGYVLDFKIFNAKDFGIAQSRERVFIVGILK